jgi:nicotinic acid mononucleotide adenylyltransferase
MEFKDFIVEAKEKTAIFTFGRFNPPTVGHQKLVDKVKDVAAEHKGDHYVYASHSADKKKNPLDVETKVKYMKKAFPNTNVIGASKETPTFMHVARKLHEAGYKHLVMVAGSDRVEEYHKLLHNYNGKDYHFKSIKVVSAGQRDPDAEGTEGMSASKMRDAATRGDHINFHKGLPDTLSKDEKTELMHHVRRGMGLQEESKNFWGDPKTTERFLKATPGATGKMKRKTYNEVYREMFGDKTVPVLCMTKEQRDALFEAQEDSMVIEYEGYRTSNLDQCPGAVDKFKDLIKKHEDKELNALSTGQAIEVPAEPEPSLEPQEPKHIRMMKFKQYLEV